MFTTSFSNTNLIAQQNLGRCPFPTPGTSSRNHISAGRIDVQVRDHSCSMSRDDKERDCRMLEGLLLLEVIESQDIV